MEFPGLRLLLFAIICIAIATGRSIDCGSNTFLNSKGIACRGGYGGTYMPPGTGGGGIGGTGSNGGGNGAGDGAGGGNGAGGGADGAMGAIPGMLMRQAMGTIMNMTSMG